VRRRRDCRTWSAGKRVRAVLPARIVEKGYGNVGEARNAGAVATLASPTALFILRPNSDQVERLVAGPSVYICDECIKTCVAVLEQDGSSPSASR
jgi:hypothetical protein